MKCTLKWCTSRTTRSVRHSMRTHEYWSSFLFVFAVLLHEHLLFGRYSHTIYSTGSNVMPRAIKCLFLMLCHRTDYKSQMLTLIFRLSSFLFSVFFFFSLHWIFRFTSDRVRCGQLEFKFGLPINFPRFWPISAVEISSESIEHFF